MVAEEETSETRDENEMHTANEDDIYNAGKNSNAFVQETIGIYVCDYCYQECER